VSFKEAVLDLFINDLINTLEEFGVSVKLSADDVKMYVYVYFQFVMSLVYNVRSMY